MTCLPTGVRNWIGAAILIAAACSLTKGGPQSGEGERKQILATARQSYYNLRQAGLIEFQVSIKPNWQMVADFQSHSDVVKLLDGLHFSMSIDSESKLRIDHQTELIPTSAKSSDYIDRIFKDMDEAVSRFISTWSVFMLTSPFSTNDSSYEIMKLVDRYEFSRREGETNVVTVTGKDFRINEIRVTGPGFKASLKPALTETPAGFILNGYSARYETGSRNTAVDVRLEYQLVNGLQLPRRVNVNTLYEGKPGHVEWWFTDYQVKVR